ncbi:nickel ABC transporter permease [Spirochaeta africana]|uniref:ABC-type dipeptide/oligopeptide/nickel transport system, permease component n=1 Tax=Spirochaeta africana (strain ATCC 700263 / DSM 8902 / Z-7692) TaxID=889378 RepID=H9UGF9_SPIAZ|nr:nickel ABC transporter permease [Spirochaeta africana]AFG36602.1 ABC-type dipeptide/oligopeptide/nickel transport system, permease component [Spirochaeta africana DSM 8902]
MHRYILRRLFLLIPVILGVSFVVFSIMYFTPGDPAKIMLGERAPEAEVEALRESMGLNDPFAVRYVSFIGNALRGEFGRSLVTRRPVAEELFGRFPATLSLAAAAVLISVAIGIPIGIISAIKQYSLFDNISMGFALIGVSMPNFWQGLMMILLFSVTLGWFPSSGYGSFRHLVMPAITLGTSSMALITRMTRSSMLEVVRQDYIRTARAKGLSENIVINRHALKNALIPIVTVVGLQFGYLLGGAVLTETVFAWPGVGRLMVDAIRQKDFPMVQSGVLLLAVAFSLVNLGVDILYAYIDPRIKAQYK